jgi:transposase
MVSLKVGKSVRTLQSWKKCYLEKGVHALAPKQIPGRPAEAIRGWVAVRITELRIKYNWGAEAICAHLRGDYQISISQWRVKRYLKRSGLITKRRKKKLKNTHTKKIIVTVPGRHTQMDVKHLPKIMSNGQKVYVYNFVDHASRWEFKRAYTDIGAAITEIFVRELLAAVPFKIARLQTDNGSEFTNHLISHVDEPRPHILDEICTQHNIRHGLIPPGEKELNGLVERSHRADDEEFYHRTKVDSLAELNRLLKGHCYFRNYVRRRKALGWKTSNEWLDTYLKNQIQLTKKASDIEITRVQEAA